MSNLCEKNYKKQKKIIPDKVSKGNISVLDRLRVLNKKQRHAVLATYSNGQPYTSLMSYALTHDMKGVILITPRLTRKYKNILKNNKVSLLIDTRSNLEKGYLNAESITILGNAQPAKKGNKWSKLAQIFLKKHPKLIDFVYSPETAIILIEIKHCFHVTKFQEVSEWHKN